MPTYHDHSAHSTILVVVVVVVSRPHHAGQEQGLAHDQLITLRAIARARGGTATSLLDHASGVRPKNSHADAAACLNLLAELLGA